MTEMVAAYQENNLDKFEKTLQKNRESVMNDAFVKEHIEELLANIRTQVRFKSFLLYILA